MSRWIRAWGATVLAWALVLLIGGVALAGAGHPPTHPQKPSVSSSHSPDASDSETPDPSESPKAESTAAADNHGACVSHWAHQAKDQGLHGRFFGQFISGVAQSGDTGANCDESDAFAKALQSQQSAPTTHGHSNGHAPTNSGS